jgi:hypothetical protein
MSKETVTGATGDNLEVPSPEEPVDSTGSTTQDSTKKLEEFERQLKETAEQLEALKSAKVEVEAKAAREEAARQEAERRAQFEESKYKGLQRETNKKDDRLKSLEQQVAAQSTIQTQLARQEKLIAKLVEQTLDPDAVAQFRREIEAASTAEELERLRNQIAQSQVNQGPPPLTAEYKQQLYEAYFRKDYPDVNPFDLSIEEWHQEAATPPEWAASVRAEFEKRQVKSVKPSKTESPDEISARIRAEVEAAYKSQREDEAKKLAEQEVTLKAQAAELAEIKRLAQEQLNRASGMDRSHESVGEPGTPSATSKIAKKLAAIPDEWLNSPDPKLRKQYSERINSKALRDELVADAQARQNKQ